MKPPRGCAAGQPRFWTGPDSAQESTTPRPAESRRRVLGSQPDLDEGGDAEPQGIGVEQRDITTNDAGFLEETDTTETGRGRQPHPLGELGIRDPAVILEDS